MQPIEKIPIGEIEGAQARIQGLALKTPLVRLQRYGEESGATGGLWLKLECLQSIGSFKIRGAANAIALAPPDEIAGGVYTASAGNMAQGLALAARSYGIACRVVVPDSAPRAKLNAIARLGAVAVQVPFDEWWGALRDHGHPDEKGFFVHPVSHPAVIAGNGTAGLEIFEALPEVDAVVVPFGGGGLSCGIASALKAKKPDVRVFAAEVDTAAPLAASLTSGSPSTIERRATFVDGIGGSSMLPEMWPLVTSLIDGSLVVSVSEICTAIRTLAEDVGVVAEGAGGSALAACAQLDPSLKTVAVISGGNIDTDIFAAILRGECPGAD
jgi:threonine dehydratase